MKRILFVDFIDEIGHLNFNTIHINALLQRGFDVSLAFHSSIAVRLPFSDEMYAALIPVKFDKKKGRHPVLNRLKYISSLLYLKCHLELTKYDYVFVSKCDAISLFLIPLCKGKFIFSHNNGIDFDSPLKGWCLKRIANRNHFIVFNDSMTRPFIDNGVKNLYIVSHGCLPIPKIEDNLHIPAKRAGHVIFHPSTKYDIGFVRFLIEPNFINFLKSNDILLVFRNFPLPVEEGSNIQSIDSYIEEDEYVHWFMASDIILLCYPGTVRYQASGVSFECVTYRKKLLYLNNHSLDYCKSFFNYDPSFDSVKLLKDKILSLLSDGPEQCIVSNADVAPDYSSIFHESSGIDISVIIPSFRPDDYLWQCLDSVIRQDLDNEKYEIILVLNGEREPFYSQIIGYFSSKENIPEYSIIYSETAGASHARNLGIDKSRGEYICFIDDDDYISEVYLSELLNKAGKSVVPISNALTFMDGTSQITYKYRKSLCFDKYSGCGIQSINNAKTFFSGPVYKILHRDIIGERRFDEFFKNGEDTLFMFQISDKISKIVFTSEKAIYFRRNREVSLTSNMYSFKYRIIRAFRMTVWVIGCYIKAPLRYNPVFFVTRLLSIFKSLLIW